MKHSFSDFRIKYGILISLLQAAVICGIVLVCVCPLSCKMTEEGISIVEGDYQSPVIESFSVTGAKRIRFVFSKKVTLYNLNLSPETEINSVKYETSGQQGSLCYADIALCTSLETGGEYSLYGEAFDASGNSLVFCVPFSGYNSEVPEIEITEIRPMYKGESNGNGKFFCEYVELHAVSSGNLAGLELFSLSDGEEKSYRLPPVRVSADEIILVHLRSKGEGCISELGEDLNISTAQFSAENVRDLWSDNEDARLNDKADILVLRNSADGSIIDLVPYAKSEISEWKNDAYSVLLKEAVSLGLWEPDEKISSAVNTDGITATKSILKSSAGKNAGCWHVSETNGGTPGVI